MSDTVYALASGQGRAGIAVIRVSGSSALESLRALSGRDDMKPRCTYLCKLIRPVSRETLDEAMIIPFTAPYSYTGEDVVEYHVHGGIAVIQGVISALSTFEHHRMAEPGEFTRRAFENGKMDLTKAEAVADLIHAETEAQKMQSLSQMGGALADIYDGWRISLTKILAYVEAELEFPDEDLPDDIVEKITPKIDILRASIADHLDDNRRGERLRNGIHVAVIGAPNAGKSSLVNALVRRDVAIVSDIAGTTRDIIEAHLDIGGYPVILSDTAGLRPDQIGNEGHEKIEAAGIERALKIAKEADIRVILYDGTQETPDSHSLELEQRENTLVVVNKVDQNLKIKHPNASLKISVTENTGITAFLSALESMIKGLIGTSNAPALTQERHREALINCMTSLDRCLSAPLPELCAEDLRLAIRDLGRITGRVDVEDLLDVVFRDFCIGK